MSWNHLEQVYPPKIVKQVKCWTDSKEFPTEQKLWIFKIKLYFEWAESMIKKYFCGTKLLSEDVFRKFESLLKYNTKVETKYLVSVKTLQITCRQRCAFNS